MIHGLIFDFDGLILDTEQSSYQSWQEIYLSHNCHLPMNEWAKCIGGSSDLFDPCEYLETRIGCPIARADIIVRRRQRHLELVSKQPVLPGVEDYIVQAKSLGMKIGLASSSPYAWVNGHLTRLGLRPFFDAVKCADHVTRIKPDPELYLAALAELGLQAHEAIVLEDSPNGVHAAQRAGIFCVAVPNPITNQLPLDHADLKLTSMADVTLGELLREVSLLKDVHAKTSDV